MRVGVRHEPVALANERRALTEPAHVIGRQCAEIALDAAVEPPEAVKRLAGHARVLAAEPVGGEKQRLVVPEQAADRAAALRLEAPDEVDRADAVGPTVDEVADEPEARVGADPPLGPVDETRVAEQPHEHVPVAVSVAHDENRSGREH